MKNSFIGSLFVGVGLSVVAAIAAADDAKDDAIKKDQKRLEGTWRVVALEVSGNKAEKGDALKLTVVNGADGTWSLLSEGQEISKGTSTIDPTKKPKTINNDHETGNQKGKKQYGIYKVEGDKWTVCMSPPDAAESDRPKDFTTKDTRNVIFVFERVKEEKKP